MQSYYTYERNLIDPADAEDIVTFGEAVELVVNALHSYGDFSSATRPYRIVESVKLDYAGYDRKAHDVVGRITIRTALQNPAGDNADQDTSYILTREMMRKVAEGAPDDIKTDVTRAMIGFDAAHTRYEQAQKESLKHIINRLGKGNGRVVGAPQPARFRKNKPFAGGPR